MNQTVFKRVILILVLLAIAVTVFYLFGSESASKTPTAENVPAPYSSGPSGSPSIGEPTSPMPE